MPGIAQNSTFQKVAVLLAEIHQRCPSDIDGDPLTEGGHQGVTLRLAVKIIASRCRGLHTGEEFPLDPFECHRDLPFHHQKTSRFDSRRPTTLPAAGGRGSQRRSGGEDSFVRPIPEVPGFASLAKDQEQILHRYSLGGGVRRKWRGGKQSKQGLKWPWWKANKQADRHAFTFCSELAALAAAFFEMAFEIEVCQQRWGTRGVRESLATANAQR